MPRPTHFFIFSQQENHATNIPIILTNVYILLHYYCLLLPFLIDYKKKKFTPFSHFPVVFLFYIIIVISILRSDFMKKLKTTQQCSATSTSSTVIHVQKNQCGASKSLSCSVRVWLKWHLWPQGHVSPERTILHTLVLQRE